MTDANGAEWRDVYYGGVLLMRVDPLGAETVYDYDEAFDLTRVTDPVGAVTELGYDAAGNVTSVTDPLGAVTLTAYDGLNNLLAVVDPSGHETRFGYDDTGNLVESVDPTGAASRFEVDARGLVVGVTDPLGAATRLEHDQAGRLVAVVSPSGHRSTRSYDAAGWVVETVDARGHEPGAEPETFAWRFERDAAGAVLAETDPLGAATSSVYDPVGRLVQRSDALGRVTGWRYDPMGRLVAVVAPDGSETTHAYDAAGRLVSRSDAMGRTTGYGYDPAGRLVEVADPLGHRWTYAYDTAGRPVQVVDANAHAAGDEPAGTTGYSYDAAGRLVAVEHGDATADVMFGYDAAGRRVEMRDGSGTVAYAYDPRGLVTAVARAGEPGFAYRYDAAGRLVERRYPDGTVVGQSWDPDGRLVAVTGDAGTPVTFGYDAAGHPVGAVHDSGAHDTWTVDAAGRVASVQVRDPAGELVAAHGYVRDANGNPLVEERLAERVDYRYDVLDQLIEACHLPTDSSVDCESGAVQRYRYAYDTVGNRLEADTPEGSRRFTYDAADRLTTIADAAATVAVTHDANGNRLDEGTRRYRWDSAGRLVEVQMPGEQRTVAYRYDGDGTRLSATITGPAGHDESSLDLAWDVNHPLPELAIETSGDGEPLRRYVHGPDGPLTVTGADMTGALHRDGLGSVTALTGADGTHADTYAYEPFGAPLGQRGHRLPLGFTGQYHDPATGLVHLRARDYDPATGRFLSPDPWPGLAEDPHLAARVYTGNRPTVFTDPAGLLCMIGRNPNGTCRGAAPTRNILQTVHLTADYVAIGAGAATLVCMAVCQPAVPILVPVSGAAGHVSTFVGAALSVDHCFEIGWGESSCHWAIAGAAIGAAPGASGSALQRYVWNLGGSRVQRKKLKDAIDGVMSMLSGVTSSASRQPAHGHPRPQQTVPRFPMVSEPEATPK
jgi:RHS repeat-associated protein